MSNLSFIKQYASNKLLKQKTPKVEHIKNLTHLFMHFKNIQNIGDLSVCKNLQVLYLHNNNITKIINLDPLLSLKHLYLNNNRIAKIEGLNKLQELQKLCLGSNEISVIEGLEHLSNLEELQIEKQRLCKGEVLCFDPRSILTLADTLQILNISNNNLTTISDLRPLKRLRILHALHNNITDVNEVTDIINSWFYLTELNFIGNPMVKQHRYRDRIIASTFNLVLLDEKEVNSVTRQFIKSFEGQQFRNRLNMVKDCKSQIKVPKNFPGKIPPAIEESISKSLIRNLSNSMISTALNSDPDVYIPWNALKPSVSDTGKVVPPLFMKQQQRKKPGTKKVQFATVFPQFP